MSSSGYGGARLFSPGERALAAANVTERFCTARRPDRREAFRAGAESFMLGAPLEVDDAPERPAQVRQRIRGYYHAALCVAGLAKGGA